MRYKFDGHLVTTNKLEFSKVERMQFTSRLIERLFTYHGIRPSPTALAAQFNLRSGGPPVTSHAVHKWLAGQSIPTQDKLRVLANWLHVTPEWLRFGGDESHLVQGVSVANGSEEERLIQDFSKLNRRSQEIVRGLIDILLKKS